MEDEKFKTIKETQDELMIEEFGDSWTKGFFEETNMQEVGYMVKKAIERTRKDVSGLINERIEKLEEAKRLFKESNKKGIYPQENPIIEAKLTELRELKKRIEGK